jgi:hypothetical protein
VRGRLLIVIVGAGPVLVVASIGAFTYLPITRVQPNRMAQLIPTAPPAGFTGKPTNSSSQSPSSSPLAVVKAAANRSTHSTGMYLTGWGGATASSDFASMLVYRLPSTSDATTAASQAIQAYLSPQTYTPNAFALRARFAIPRVPGASAAWYVPTSAKAKQNLATFTEHVDKVLVVAVINRSVSSATVQADADTWAQTEYAHLRSTAPEFSLVQTRWPTVATLVYAGITGSVVLCVLTVPSLVRRTGHRRRMAQEAAARRQVMIRGGKIAKRQSANRR